MSRAKLWGGAFDKAPDELAWAFGKSLDSDMTLLKEELEVSIAHAEMLGGCGILSDTDAKAIVDGLKAVQADLAIGRTPIAPDAEDLHGAIEWLLEQKIGEAAKRLHAGRSRNDQIVTVTRLWLKRRCTDLREGISATQKVLLDLASKHANDLMPGYTHMQPAQPVTLGYHLLAYFWMLERDRARFDQVAVSADESPLGSAALAGTSLPIDPAVTCAALGFSRPSANALDAVSDRDFVGDALHACATLMQHLSRIAQEIVLFSTAEYGYMKLDQALSTGSSIMPQKRNPDLAELIRGRAGRVVGHWTGFMCAMKGLPMGYHRDMQEDKPPLFDSIKLCEQSLALTGSMLGSATFVTGRMAENAGAGHSTATAVAEALVTQGVPFRVAHETVGSLVRTCLLEGKSLAELADNGLPTVTGQDLRAALACATPAASVAARKSPGGPAPEALEAQFQAAKAALANHC